MPSRPGLQQQTTEDSEELGPPRQRAGELLMKWGVTAGLSETSHWTSRPDLGPRWHMGVKEVRKLRRGGSEGAPSCPLRLSRDPQLSQQTLTSPHTKHPPGRGGAASFLFQTEGWKRGRMEGKARVISSSCCCEVGGMLGSAPAAVLHHFWSQAANLLIIAAKGWRCDLNSYFKSGADLWEPLRRESRSSRSRAEEVPASTVAQQNTAAVLGG